MNVHKRIFGFALLDLLLTAVRGCAAWRIPPVSPTPVVSLEDLPPDQRVRLDPRSRGELDISRWVDHSCSAINYLANLTITAPAGVPYW